MVARTFSLADPPYTGTLGSTRREVVFVPTQEGGARRVEILRGVNAVTDALLVRQCVEGSLHRHGDHDLAVPYVFHDPGARRFALVVPPALAHQELTLRADLLTRLANDTAEPIPAYVREARTVLGPAGLRRWLEEPDEKASREDFAAREERIRRRAEEVTRRESDALVREEAIALREESVAQEELAMRANMAALAARETKLVAREESAVEPPIEAVAEAEAPLAAVESQGGEESMELEPDELTGRLSLGRVEAAVESAEIDPEPDELAAEEVSNLDDVVIAAAPPPEEALRPSPRSTTPWAAVVDGTVRLWCPGSSETAALVSADDVTARVQIAPDGTQPLALLALLRDDGAATIARVVLDLRSPEDRGVLESLGRVFRVRVEVVSPAGRSIASHVLGAPCEPVAQRALEVLGARTLDPAVITEESAKLLKDGVVGAVPASVAVPDDERDLSTADGVTRSLSAYAPLLDGATLAEASLTTGVPVAQIEASAKRLILAALRVGAVLPRPFVERALKAGVAADEATLVARAMQAYRRAIEAGIATIGRKRADASMAWGPLLDRARVLELPIDATVRAAVAAVWDPDDASSTAPPDDRTAPSSIAAMDLGERLSWITHPAVRWDVARSLAGPEAPAHIPALRLAFHRLPAADCVRLAVELLPHGDALADLWVELLSSPRPALVGVSATVAGTLRLRRALTPLVQRALSPGEEAWRLMGWAAGGFGAALVRAVSRPEGAAVDRLAWALAHAVAQGGAKEMERARPGADPTFEQAATRALAQQEEVQRWTSALRDGKGETDIERVVAPLLRRAGEFAAR